MATNERFLRHSFPAERKDPESPGPLQSDRSFRKEQGCAPKRLSVNTMLSGDEPSISDPSQVAEQCRWKRDKRVPVGFGLWHV